MNQEENIWDIKNTTANGNAIKLPPSKRGARSSLDLDFRRILRLWPLVIAFGIAGYFVGKFYLRYVRTIFLVSTSINIEQKEEVSIGKALLGSARDPFNDQIAYFKSPVLSLNLVDSLHLNFHAEAQGTFKDKDFYGLVNWKILKAEDKNLPLLHFTVIPSEKKFICKESQKLDSIDWGMPFQIDGNWVVVNKLKDIHGNAPIFCYNTDNLQEAFSLSNSLKIVSNKESNIINISYSDYSSARAIDVLNGLTHLYNQIIEQDKTRSFSQAIGFVEGRLAPLGRELDSIENALAHFKSVRGFVGNTANGTLYLDKTKDLDKTLNDLNVTKQTILSVERFIQNPGLKDENLALVGISDPVLQNYIVQYQRMWSEKEKLQMTQTANHPNMIQLESHMSGLKNNINVQLQNYKNNLKISEANYQNNLSVTNSMLRNTPMDEKELLGKQRLQNIKENLFMTLLQKREEAAIAKASVTVNTKILTPPIKANAIKNPEPKKIMGAAVLIGLLLPLLVAIIIELINRKIISKRQIKSITDIPVIAELQHVEELKENPIIIDVNKRSMIGEQLRSLRTNLDFYEINKTGSKYILITSSMSGEGKSFLSVNLARSYSLQGKKVALLEFDLRRPKISKLMNVSKELPGLSSFLIGKYDVSQIIFKPSEIGDNEVLDVFPAGAIPPNPQELLSGIKMNELKEYLDTHYDVVIMDSPPYGIVADAQILGQWALLTIVLTRFRQTMVEQVIEINEWHQNKIFNNMAIVFNGIRSKGYFGYKYGYYYYRGKYGQGYYNESNS